MKNKLPKELTDKRDQLISELEAELQGLKMVNQALCDELDAIYGHQENVNDLFECFLEAEHIIEAKKEYKGTLH